MNEFLNNLQVIQKFLMSCKIIFHMAVWKSSCRTHIAPNPGFTPYSRSSKFTYRASKIKCPCNLWTSQAVLFLFCPELAVSRSVKLKTKADRALATGAPRLLKINFTHLLTCKHAPQFTGWLPGQLWPLVLAVVERLLGFLVQRGIYQHFRCIHRLFYELLVH